MSNINCKNITEVTFDKREDLKNGFVFKQEKFFLFEDTDISGEENLESQITKDYSSKMEELDAKYLLTYFEKSGEIFVAFNSKDKSIRALEFIDFLLPEFGLAKGNASYAVGKISASILGVWMQEENLEEVSDFLCCLIKKYYLETNWIDSVAYGEANRSQISSLPVYYKKKVAWAFVETTKLAKEGEMIYIRSLENESGIYIESKKDNYIMIGCRGEIYNISKEKFEATYETTDEPLDIFESMLDYMPEIQLESDHSYFSLDEIAKICYPKSGAGIYATELSCRTKIFYKGGNGEYHLGRTKDYMAIRTDDLTDIYIIRQDIFRRTYEIG